MVRRTQYQSPLCLSEGLKVRGRVRPNMALKLVYVYVFPVFFLDPVQKPSECDGSEQVKGRGGEQLWFAEASTRVSCV